MQYVTWHQSAFFSTIFCDTKKEFLYQTESGREGVRGVRDGDTEWKRLHPDFYWRLGRIYEMENQ